MDFQDARGVKGNLNHNTKEEVQVCPTCHYHQVMCC